MPNPYRFKHNINIFKKQLENGVDKIHDNLKENKDLEFSSIIRNISTGIKDTILTLGKPSFQNRKAKKIPSQDDYNKNIEEICNDLEICYDELRGMKDVLKTYFNYNTLSSKDLESKVKELDNETKNISLHIKAPLKDRVYIARDDFNNTNKIDEKETSSEIDVMQGSVLLKRESSVNRNDKEAEISITGNSNGFPGNLHQVIVKDEAQSGYKEDMEKNITFLAEEDGHIYLSAVQDKNPDTWFEYELANFPTSKKKNPCEWFGLDYEDGTVWAKDPKDGKLKLTIRIVLPEAEIINWIDISPYTPKNGHPIVIKTIKTAPSLEEELDSIYKREYLNHSISDNTNGRDDKFYDENDIPGQNDFTGHGVFAFSPKKVKIIELSFEQDSPYDCKIGHIYFVRTVKLKITKSSFFGLIKKTKYETKKFRIEGPKTDLDALTEESHRSLIGAAIGGWAGAKTGATLGAALGPLGAVIGGVLGGILGSFFGKKDVDVISDNVDSGVEAFDGWRWAIGLRDINVNSYTYASKSQVVSESIEVPGQISKIELDASEQIPELFYSEQTEQTKHENKNEWIKYFVSIDKGTSWHRISPVDDIESKIPSVIYVNSDLPGELQDDTAKYITANEETNSVKFKAILSRPTDLDDAQFFSPLLRAYTLKVGIDKEGDN